MNASAATGPNPPLVWGTTAGGKASNPQDGRPPPPLEIVQVKVRDTHSEGVSGAVLPLHAVALILQSDLVNQQRQT